MNSIQLTGILGSFGALIYAIGDVLLLAGKINIDQHPKLKPFQKLLSDAGKMAALSSEKMMWGALLGVFATPLVIAGFWPVYQGLAGANNTLAFVTFILFSISSVIGAFVHGTFFYMGEYVKALENVNEDSQQIIAGMIERHKKILMISYFPILFIVLMASILFAFIVGMGATYFPAWMIVINPVTLTIAWLLLKRVLPKFVHDATEGAGFNIAYFTFFTCCTISLWNL
jgi:hypothetical protein